MSKQQDASDVGSGGGTVVPRIETIERMQKRFETNGELGSEHEPGLEPEDINSEPEDIINNNTLDDESDDESCVDHVEITVVNPTKTTGQHIMDVFTIPRLVALGVTTLLGILIYATPWLNVPEENGGGTKSWCTGQQFYVLNMLIWMVVLMIEGISPEFVILGMVFLSFFIDYIFKMCGKQDLFNLFKGEPASKMIYAGLCSGGTLTYAGMFIISAVFQETRILEKFLSPLIQKPRSHMAFIARLLLPSMMLSAFSPNGPVVQMCIPLVVAAADRVGVYTPRTYFMALAFAVTMGGNLTLIGSTPCLQILEDFNKDVNVDSCRLSTVHMKKWTPKAPDGSWWFDDVVGGNGTGKITRELVNDEEKKLEKIIQSVCRMEIFDLGFFTTGFLNCLFSIPALWYAIWIFARLEDKQRAEEEGVELATMENSDTNQSNNIVIGGNVVDAEENDPQDSSNNVDLERGENHETASLLPRVSRQGSSAPYVRQSSQISAVRNRLQHPEEDASANRSVAFDMENNRNISATTSRGYATRNDEERNYQDVVKIPSSQEEGNNELEGIHTASGMTNGATTRSRALARYHGQPGLRSISVLNIVEQEPSKRQALYDVEMKLCGEVQDLTGCILAETALYNMKDVEVYLHIVDGSNDTNNTTKDSVNGSIEPLLNGDAKDIRLKSGDILGIRAKAVTIGKLQRQFEGLIPSTEFYPFLGRSRKMRQLFEVLVMPKYLARKNFEKKFFLEHQAVIIGADIGNGIVLVEAFNKFATSKNIHLKFINTVPGSRPPRSNTTADLARGIFAVFGFTMVILMTSVDFFKLKKDLHTLAIGLGILLVMFRCLTWKQALASINGGVLMLFALSGCVNDLMKNTETEKLLATTISNMAGSSKAAAIFGLGILVGILTQFLNNQCVTALLFQTTMQLCLKQGIPKKPMAVMLPMMSGMAMMTPIGMPPTLLVQQPGNYAFIDYVKAGWLMQLITTLFLCGFTVMWVYLETKDPYENTTFIF